MRLYYPELATGSLSEDIPFSVATVDPMYLTIKVSVSEKDYDKALASLLCHKSQYTPEFAEKLHQLVRTTQKGVAYFRPFDFNGQQQSFFP
jgi:hypothetical protein